MGDSDTMIIGVFECSNWRSIDDISVQGVFLSKSNNKISGVISLLYKLNLWILSVSKMKYPLFSKYWSSNTSFHNLTDGSKFRDNLIYEKFKSGKQTYTRLSMKQDNIENLMIDFGFDIKNLSGTATDVLLECIRKKEKKAEEQDWDKVKEIQNRIIKVYNYDGPGFNPKIVKQFKRWFNKSSFYYVIFCNHFNSL